MRFGRRAVPTATYAAIVGDRWLWVALGGPAEVSLHGPEGRVEVPVEVDDGQPGHHGVRLDLAALPARPTELAVRTGRAALAVPPLQPQGPGTTYALERDEATHLHVVRRAPTAGATLRALRLVGERVELDLDGADGHDAVVLTAGDTPVASLPLVDGTAVLTPADLATATPGERALRVLVGGAPVRRRANDLADPGTGALLPFVHPAGAESPLARLRWASDATLTVRVLR